MVLGLLQAVYTAIHIRRGWLRRTCAVTRFCTRVPGLCQTLTIMLGSTQRLFAGVALPLAGRLASTSTFTQPQWYQLYFQRYPSLHMSPSTCIMMNRLHSPCKPRDLTDCYNDVCLQRLDAQCPHKQQIK